MSNAADSTLEGTQSIQVEALKIADPAALGGSSSATHFISPWTPDSNASSHFTVFQHGLGAIPTSLFVQFSVDLETVHPLMWPWQASSTGNPCRVSMDAKTVTLGIAVGFPLHGWWNGAAPWTVANSGYWRVIASV
jgi:hypothetical protein